MASMSSRLSSPQWLSNPTGLLIQQTSTEFACLGSHGRWKVVSLLTFLFTCVMQALQMYDVSASDFPVKLMITLFSFFL